MTKMFCDSCGKSVHEDARFRPECGTRLVGASPVRSRFMSVLFVDLAASTALTTAIGDEAMFALVVRFQDLCRNTVADAGGYVAKFMGDGMLAYFGYPGAMKDSAGSAVATALTIVERAAHLGPEGGPPLRVSAGVATGWVVVGDAHAGPAARETLAIGGTVNMAARLLASTGPGSVAVGDEVSRRLDPAVFARQFIGLHDLKGFANPIAVWTIARANQRPTVPDFVGRAGAMARLDAIWADVKSGSVRAVEVVAPGGYGKTTLARRFLAAAANDHEVLELRGLSHRREQSLACLKPLVAALAGLDPATPTADQLARLSDFASGPVAEGLALLLGLDQVQVPPLIRQDKVRHALMGLLEAAITPGRIVLFVEDAHWIDPETRALLAGLPDVLAGHAVLLIATRRPEGGAVWPDATTVDLAALPDAEASEMLAALDPAGQLASQTRAGIIHRAGGVPLFIEHIARAMLERPDEAPSVAVPDTLVEALLERFDRLGDGQALVEAAAVLGPLVRMDVLAAMLAPMPRSVVAEQVERLVARGLFRQDSPQAIAFDHALVRDAVSETLLSAQQIFLHSLALAAWEAAAPDALVADPAIAATHLLGAARPAEAIPRLIDVARRAIATGALSEALASLSLADTALDDLPAGRLRDDLEMVTRFFLGGVLVQTRGFADASVNAAYQRALDLCLSHAGGGEEEFQIVWGIWAHMLVVGDTMTAGRMTERMEQITANRPELAVLVASAQTVNAFTRGDLAEMEAAWTRTDAAYDPDLHRFQAITYLMDARQLALLFLVHGRWIAGDMQGWQAAMAQIAAHEAHLGLPFLSPYIRVFGNAPHCYALPRPDTRDVLQAASALAMEQGQPFWSLSAMLWLAAFRAQTEGAAAAIADQEAALAMCHATGLRLTISFHEALLARSLAELGRHDEAATMIALALAAIDAGQDRAFLPEVLRQQAEIALLANPDDKVTPGHILGRAAQESVRLNTAAWGALIAGSVARIAGSSPNNARHARQRLDADLAALAHPETTDHPAFVLADRSLRPQSAIQLA